MWHGSGKGEVFTGLFGRPEGKRPLVRPRHMWEDNIKIYTTKLGIDGANWIQLCQDNVQWWDFVSTVMKLRVQ
jgi:hypothetical protein